MNKYQQIKSIQLLIVGLISVFLLINNVCEAREKDEMAVNCQNLGEVTDIDNLLYQFYSNIDSQCLFRMPVAELEEIWGVRVLDYTNLSLDAQLALNDEFHKLKKNKDGIFITKRKDQYNVISFSVHTTDKYYKENKGWGGVLKEGKLPILIPAPEVISESVEDYYRTFGKPHIHGDFPFVPKTTVYKKYSKYFWKNKSNSINEPVLIIDTFEFQIPASIVLYNQSNILKTTRK